MRFIKDIKKFFYRKKEIEKQKQLEIKNIKYIKNFIKKSLKERTKKKSNFLMRVYYKYKFLYYILIKKQFELIPNGEELTTKAISIIRNYETSAQFNKIKLFKLLGERRKPLNIYYYLFSKYFAAPDKLKFFIPKKYKKLTDFFIEPSVEKSKNILLYLQEYYNSNNFIKTKLIFVLGSFLILVMTIFVLIGLVFYINFYFMTNLYGKFDWNRYYSRLGTVEHLIFDNTMYLGFLFKKNTAQIFNLSHGNVLQGALNNVFFWIGIISIIGLIGYISYYVISQYNLLHIFKYINERNFNLWFLVLLERIKIIEQIDHLDEITGKTKKRRNITYKNEDLYKLFNINLIKTYDYKLINYNTRQKLFQMSIMNKKNQGLIFKKKKFFSEKFRVFWLEIFDLVNKGSQGKFNLSYLEKHLKNRYESFKTIWEIEVTKVTNIAILTILVITTFVMVQIITYQLREIQTMSNAVEMYHQQQNNH